MAASRSPGYQCGYCDPVDVNDGTSSRALSPNPATTGTKAKAKFSLLGTRSVRITGFSQSLTLFGTFTDAAEKAISDGWLSVVDFWTLGLPQSTGEPALQFLYRCFYGRTLVWSRISSAPQPEQLNVGYKKVVLDSGTLVIADLKGLPGMSADNPLRGNRYDFWRNTTTKFTKATTAQGVINTYMTRINAEPDIAPDDKTYLRGLILMRTLAQDWLVSLGTQRAGRAMSTKEKEQFSKADEEHPDYRGMAEQMKIVLPAVGINNW